MDEAERLARQLDQDQKNRFKRFRGTREEFYNEYERNIYFEIVRLFKKSKTYKQET